MITSQEIAENYPISEQEKISFALKTISDKAFYFIVFQTLKAKGQLSVVRMGDGERRLIIDCITAKANKQADQQVSSFDLQWRKRMGIDGITYRILFERLIKGITGPDYFAPNINGLHQPDYSLYPWYKAFSNSQPLVDNFFVNNWSLEDRSGLLKLAKNVLVFHSNPVTVNTFAKRARAYLDVGIRHIPLADWRQAETVVNQALQWDYPLALVSAGPASKWIIQELSIQGRVVLDLGNAMDHWLLLELYKDNPSKLDGK
jgi:hypothetical protein